MKYKAPDINPEKLGKIVMERVSGVQAPFVDDAVLSLYNIGRRLANDPQWGEVYVSDVIGCNFRCAHCWVSSDALNGDTDSEFVRKKAAGFVTAFRHETNHSADSVFDYLQKRSKGKEQKVFAFTGGETSFYRAGLQRMARRALEADDDITIGIDTNAWLIAQHDDYLDAWQGLQDVVYVYVSIKGTTPQEFQRFTGVQGEHYDAAFVAIEKLLKKGFRTIPGGIVLNMFANEHELMEKENPVTRLYDRLSRIHPLLPSMISCQTVSRQVHDQKHQSKTMKQRGYVNTRPSLVRKTLIEHFKEHGTPIIELLPENAGVPGIISKRETLEKIIHDLH